MRHTQNIKESGQNHSGTQDNSVDGRGQTFHDFIATFRLEKGGHFCRSIT